MIPDSAGDEYPICKKKVISIALIKMASLFYLDALCLTWHLWLLIQLSISLISLYEQKGKFNSLNVL